MTPTEGQLEAGRRAVSVEADDLVPLVVDEPARPVGFDRLPLASSRRVNGAWHAAQTRPRQEKALGEALCAKGIACFVPLVRKVRYYSHRKRTVELPLFPSYTFLHGTSEDVVLALQTDRVARMLRVPDQSQLEHELAQIDKALAGGAVLDPYPYLSVGRRVVVTRGPFQGMEGIVDVRKSPDRLVLVISMLGRATSVEIDTSLLEPVD